MSMRTYILITKKWHSALSLATTNDKLGNLLEIYMAIEIYWRLWLCKLGDTSKLIIIFKKNNIISYDGGG